MAAATAVIRLLGEAQLPRGSPPPSELNATTAGPGAFLWNTYRDCADIRPLCLSFIVRQSAVQCDEVLQLRGAKGGVALRGRRPPWASSGRPRLRARRRAPHCALRRVCTFGVPRPTCAGALRERGRAAIPSPPSIRPQPTPPRAPPPGATRALLNRDQHGGAERSAERLPRTDSKNITSLPLSPSGMAPSQDRWLSRKETTLSS